MSVNMRNLKLIADKYNLRVEDVAAGAWALFLDAEKLTSNEKEPSAKMVEDSIRVLAAAKVQQSKASVDPALEAAYKRGLGTAMEIVGEVLNSLSYHEPEADVRPLLEAQEDICNEMEAPTEHRVMGRPS